MTDIQIRSKEIKGSDGKVIGISKVVIDNKEIDKMWKDSIKPNKEQMLKDFGWKEDEINKIKEKVDLNA
tara:strand:+ start:3158 stop:3364 length:207 start_codon:yes stop_codon:yes gene_type:complete